MVQIAALLMTTMVAARDGEIKGVVVKVDVKKLDGGGQRIVVVLKVEKGEWRFHVPFSRTEDGWALDEKLSEVARNLKPGDSVLIGWWDADEVRMIKFIERSDREGAAPDRKDRDRDDHDGDRKDRDEGKKDWEKKEGDHRDKEGEKKDWEKKKDGDHKEAEKKEWEKKKEADQKIRGKLVRVHRERNPGGEVVKVGLVIKVEKKGEITIWVPYRKGEERWFMDKEILKRVEELEEGLEITVGFFVDKDVRFIKWVDVHKGE
jgi:hypothetical protein